MQPPSQTPEQVQGKPPSLTGKIDIKALPSPGGWMNAPKDFKILSEDSISITASTKTDLYKDVDSGAHTATAPMLLFPADDTFVLTTAVTVDFKQEYDGGFLVVY
jgi:regulation of enolase protein 1 (concanavalin A-like superfamily)